MLQGLGEPIRELRLFVKDLRFRNSQERRRGELQLQREELALAAERFRLAKLAESAGAAPLSVEPTRVPHELPPGGD